MTELAEEPSFQRKEGSLRGGAAADSECEKSTEAAECSSRNQDDTKQIKFF